MLVLLRKEGKEKKEGKKWIYNLLCKFTFFFKKKKIKANNILIHLIFVLKAKKVT
jgi:hypothetical protein